MSLQCPNGHTNADGSAFCSSCGTPVTSAAPPASPPLAATPAAAAQGVPAAPGSAPQTETQTPNLGDPVATPTAPFAASPAGPPTGPPPAAPAGATYPPQPTHPAAETPKRRRLPVVLAALAVLAILGAAGTVAALMLNDNSDGGSGSSDGKSAAADDGKTLRGIAMLYDPDGSVDGSWDDCQGTGGYNDFDEGMRLSIKGGDDEIVGSGDVVNVDSTNIEDVVQAELDGDEPIGLDSKTVSGGVEELRSVLEENEGSLCMLYFEAAIEPSDFYSVEIGSRGDLSYSRDDLKEQGFVVGISLGDF